MWRETPSIAVVAAQKRTGAATRATSQRIASATQCRVEGGDDAEHRRLDELAAERGVRARAGPATTGTAISAIAAIPA